MGMRQPDFVRRTLSVAAGATGVFDLSPYDRITGETGVIEARLTTPAASAGTQLLNAQVGNRIQTTDYAIGGEEYGGAGPNARTQPLLINGGRGDVIRLAVTNPTGGAVVTTLQMTVQAFGR